MTTYEVILTIVALLLSLFNLWELAAKQKLLGVLRTSLRNAEQYKPGGRDEVRIPYNQLAELVKWDSELFPMPDAKHTHKPGPHPATVTATRRQKMGH